MSDPVARLNAALEGRYAIERELGEGGMATVYVADDLLRWEARLHGRGRMACRTTPRRKLKRTAHPQRSSHRAE